MKRIFLMIVTASLLTFTGMTTSAEAGRGYGNYRGGYRNFYGNRGYRGWNGYRNYNRGYNYGRYNRGYYGGRNYNRGFGYRGNYGRWSGGRSGIYFSF